MTSTDIEGRPGSETGVERWAEAAQGPTIGGGATVISEKRKAESSGRFVAQ